jgi:hypothetical protein
MITIKAKPQADKNKKEFAPLPEGIYNVEVVKLGEWKPQTKDIEFINAKDSKGNLLRDDNNKIIKDKVANYTFQTLDVDMKITSGEHTGRYIFGTLTTHDNVLFLTEAFLYATGVEQLTDLNDIYNQDIIGKVLQVETNNQEYTKEITDPNTGMTSPVTKTKTRVKKYIKNSIVKPK